MDLDDEELLRILAHMKEKNRRIEGRRLVREARVRTAEIQEQIDRVRVAHGGVMAAVDRHFHSTQTFLPSTMIRTQLRLAIHYVQSADEGGFPVGKSQPPTLSSFVVLRTAIECTATAHWLLSGKNQRESVERALKRMWWDTISAADMAKIVDEDTDLSGKRDLEERIIEIARPIKGLESAMIMGQRTSLSTMVAEASSALHPNNPAAMTAGWMMCAGVAHGNIAVSAGAGLTAVSVQQPSQHLIDDGAYASIYSAVVEDVNVTTRLFGRRAIEQHQHPGPS